MARRSPIYSLDVEPKMQITQKRLHPCPAAQATAGNIVIMRVWHNPTWCAAAVAMLHAAVEQYRYNNKLMRWFGLELR